MRKKQSLDEIAKMTKQQRYKLAQNKVQHTLGYFLNHIATHVNNEIITYSDILAKQIPRSYAANSFNNLQQNLLHYELLRICTFWDEVDLDGFSIPTALNLVDDPGVEHIVYQDHHNYYRDMDNEHGTLFGQKSADRIIKNLKLAIRCGKKLQKSELLSETRNFRDKIAHLLEKTSHEKQTDVKLAKLGYEKKLITRTQYVLDRLHTSLNGSSFDFDGTWRLERKNAEALWSGVIIEVRR